MPTFAVDVPHTTARASARLAEVSPSGAPRLSCVIEGLDSGAIRVALDGALDGPTAPKADRALRAAQACAPLVVLDLRQLEFIGATAARLLLAADARARHAGGRLAVVPGSVAVHPIPELAQLFRQLEIVDPPPAELRTSGRA